MDNKKSEVLNFRTNIAEIITFPFGDFKEGTSTNDRGSWNWYKYSIQNKGVEKVLFAKEALHLRLQVLGSLLGGLQGRELEITNYEVEGGKKFWKICENGVDITPKVSSTTSHQKPATGHPSASGEVLQRIERMAEWAKKVEERLTQAELEILTLKGSPKEELPL